MNDLTTCKRALCFVAIASITLSSDLGLAHPGRTDSSGGHHNRHTGFYHMHGGGTSSKSYSTPQPRQSYRSEYRSSGRSSYSLGGLPAFSASEDGNRKEATAPVESRAAERKPIQKTPLSRERKEALAIDAIRIAIQFENSGKKDAATRWLTKACEEYPETAAATHARAYLHFRESETVFRIWTDATGGYTVEAAFVDLDVLDKKLLKRSGGVFSVKYTALSKLDQLYVDAISEGFPPI